MARKGSARDAAMRHALSAMSARQQASRLREDLIADALGDYYEAVASARRIREHGKEKAEQALGAAEVAASVPDAAAVEAVRRLRAMTGAVAEVATLCHISQAAVSRMLRSDAATEGTTGQEGSPIGDDAPLAAVGDATAGVGTASGADSPDGPTAANGGPGASPALQRDQAR